MAQDTERSKGLYSTTTDLTSSRNIRFAGSVKAQVFAQLKYYKIVSAQGEVGGKK